MMKAEQSKALREPFPAEQIGKLPKGVAKEGQASRCNVCNGWHRKASVHLDYVGHAATTDRLLQVDPEWFWEPVAFGDDGLPVFDKNGGLWIKLTIGGMSRYGYGDAQGKSGPNAVKEAIGDAIRNAAMRFGVALDLWAKEDLSADPGSLGTDPQLKKEVKRPEPQPEQPSNGELEVLLTRPVDAAVGRQGLVNRIVTLFEYAPSLGWPSNALDQTLQKRGFASIDELGNDTEALYAFTKDAYEAAREKVGVSGVEDLASAETA